MRKPAPKPDLCDCDLSKIRLQADASQVQFAIHGNGDNIESSEWIIQWVFSDDDGDQLVKQCILIGNITEFRIFSERLSQHLQHLKEKMVGKEWPETSSTWQTRHIERPNNPLGRAFDDFGPDKGFSVN